MTGATGRAIVRPLHFRRAGSCYPMIEASIVITLVVAFTFIRWITR